MDHATFVDPNLTRPDLLVLKNLLQDIERTKTPGKRPGANEVDSGYTSAAEEISVREGVKDVLAHHGSTAPLDTSFPDDEKTIEALEALNDPTHEDFDPTVFVTWDLKDVKLPAVLDRHVLRPYIAWARTVVRKETDVVVLTHLILYFTTSVPSALFLYYHFSWLHGVLHCLMQGWYVGTYTLMRHQHIHMNGILASRHAWLDSTFAYILDPLMGHTWNTYYYHHVKHHHVEANGPEDLSSTLRYQRDDLLNFLHYLGRFCFLVWLDLPLYFLRKGKPLMALKAGSGELANLMAIYLLATYLNFRATAFVFIVPLSLLRIGLMVGNWGQHAFVDDVDPDSDFRSSITLIDVASNRFCYNDGYHTSHHLNPRRHWRDHPVAFLRQKDRYAGEQALVFRNIDYVMITVRLLRKDYVHLAKCLVPIGDQVGMSLEEIAVMLRTKTRKFTEEDIAEKFQKK
ncbi:hypothetical protein H2201_002471 [Coniosporium apollinis]|uniref:Fatty acid desaturase domain-containing protein n=1 Tax=Coniosporium apollinis TaxID=61459 RepID=A0ABQ9P109_9PEZI|nr:hypothetical protein H2201_002471 [Coniosporium apollinis]